ncbi:MAG: TerC family protein [Thermoanaerobaculia bacterium]|nr:TerC family protein [Thermoanaerobaculia bacterium]
MNWWADPQIWIALGTLTLLEVVLGIDNIIFLSILAGKLPKGRQEAARRLGLGAALVTRILLLLSVAWMARLTQPLLTLLGEELSGRDLILLIGGLFLLGKATFEIHDKLEGVSDEMRPKAVASFAGVIVQMAILDVVFSLDSVITAVGMVDEVAIMVAAVCISIVVMVFAIGPLSRFVDAHPTVKILALSFLLLIGMALVAESLDHHIPKGYLYFAMGFSVLVESLNLRLRRQGTGK